MFAGSICEETNCTGLALMLLVLALGVVAVAVVTVVAWAMAVSALLQRRGWGQTSRRVTAGVYCAIGLPVVLGACRLLSVPDGVVLGLLVLPAFPMAIWQRRVTRHRSLQA